MLVLSENGPSLTFIIDSRKKLQMFTQEKL